MKGNLGSNLNKVECKLMTTNSCNIESLCSNLNKVECKFYKPKLCNTGKFL